MSITENLRKELEQRMVPFEVIPHREVFTAQEIAQSSHVPGRLLAKPVVIRNDDGTYSMIVVAAHRHVDLAAVRRCSGRPHGRLATEAEIAALFPDCELGAMPPIGRLYQIATYLDEEFLAQEDIYFQAGNHHELVKMKVADFVKVAGPFAGEFSLHREKSMRRT